MSTELRDDANIKDPEESMEVPDTTPPESLDKEDDDTKQDSDSKDEPEEVVDDRRVVLCFTSGAPVYRRDTEGKPFWEVLSLNDDAIDLTFFNSGCAPCLDYHGDERLSDVIGVIEKAWRESGDALCSVRMSKRKEVDGVLMDVRDKILRNVSVGYVVYDFEMMPAGNDGIPIKLITKWRPVEVSIVGVPADFASGIRKNTGVSVSLEKNRNEINNSSNENVIVERELSRGIEIRKAVRAAKLEEEFADTLIEGRVSIGEARKQILDEFGKRGNAEPKFQTQINITAGAQDEGQTFKRALTEALLHRANPAKNTLDGPGRMYAGISILEVAREVTKRSMGSAYGWQSNNAIAERSMATTSDFPIILANVLNKTVRDSFESAPATYQAFTKKVPANDFRDMHRVQLGQSPRLEPVNEKGEFRRGVFKESGESYRVATLGKIISLTREMLVNDSAQVFTSIPMLMGRAAQDSISDLVYGLLCGTFKMRDGKTLFDKDHNNIAATGSDITIDSISEGRSKMRLQKGQENEVLNLVPKTLLVPASLETKGQQFVTQNYLAGVIAGVAEQRINPFAGTLTCIAEPRLDAFSTTSFYLTGDTGQVDMIEIAFLDGQEGPFIDQQIGFSTSGMDYLVRMDVGAGILEYRGFFQNPGKRA